MPNFVKIVDGVVENIIVADSAFATANGYIPHTDQVMPEGPAPTFTEEEAKTRRNTILAETDWTQLSGGPLSDSDKAVWATYRQELRDLPTASGWPNPTWPAYPG
tara:strand:+ start:94 stop:408 length:315 start_codon:yes stop_codon:yes gene_type:complete